MIELDIPGRGVIRFQHLVSDVSGTLAVDGSLIEGAGRGMLALSNGLQIHLLTADTHSRHQTIDYQLGLHAVRIPAGDDPDANAATMRRLGAEQVVAVGQGANDAGMLRDAALG
ncbi:MAG: hypothetical protein MUO35_05845, partial [Anaerolineales bacterium]|nr:hypothetical protein [Anaerolineales bacterium]